MLKEKLLKEGIILGKELTLEDIREMHEEEVFVEFVDKQGWVGGNPIDDIHKINVMDGYLFKVAFAIDRSGKGFAIDTLIGNGVKAYKFERTKFKVGDKVVLANGSCWGINTKYRTVNDVIKSSCGVSYKLSSYGIVRSGMAWEDSELELYKEPKVEDTTDTGELSEDAKLRKRISKLTTENINLRQENKKLKDLLDEKDEELDEVLKDLKEVIEEGDELVNNVEKLIEFLPKLYIID